MSSEINFEPDPSGTATRNWDELDGAVGGTPKVKSYPAPGVANAYATGAVIFTGAGRLLSLTCENSAAADRYLQFWDAAALPANGAVPTQCVKVPTHSTGSFDFTPPGFPIEDGLVACLSSTETTKTIAVAADGLFTATFRERE